MTDQARETDADFMQRSARLTAVWIAIIVAAGLCLLVFGDALMAAFT